MPRSKAQHAARKQRHRGSARKKINRQNSVDVHPCIIGELQPSNPASYRFVNNALADQFKCSLCYAIMDTSHVPVHYGCPQHIQCKQCIEKLMNSATFQNRPQCPICRRPIPLSTQPGQFIDFLPVMPFARLIPFLMITCTTKHIPKPTNTDTVQDRHRDRENNHCHEELKLDGWNNHNEEHCPNAPIKCKYCSLYVPRHLIPCHLEFCKKLPWECEFCQTSIDHDVDEKMHYAECPEYLVFSFSMFTYTSFNFHLCVITIQVKCQYCKEEIRRVSMDNHFDDCPQYPVSCEFASIGCSKRVPRCEMKQHYAECWKSHQSILRINLRKLSMNYKELKDENKDIKQKNDELLRKHGILCDRIKKLRRVKKEITTKFEKRIADLNEEINCLQSNGNNDHQMLYSGDDDDGQDHSDDDGQDHSDDDDQGANGDEDEYDDDGQDNDDYDAQMQSVTHRVGNVDLFDNEDL